MGYFHENRKVENVANYGKLLLNSLDGCLVTKRLVRDRFTTLMRKYKGRMKNEVKGSWTAGDEPSEYEILIEDLIQLSDESDLKQESTAEENKNAL